ncbi:MAG: YXWGXW repeat-containing protein [Minicystis sp.]
MKLNGKILVTVAMMVGSMAAATGCNAPAGADSNAVAPEETAASAPVEESNTTAGFEQNSVRYHWGVRYYAPHAPPAARHETYGRAPSARHFWAPGYYRWNGRQHVWVAGRWELGVTVTRTTARAGSSAPAAGSTSPATGSVANRTPRSSALRAPSTFIFIPPDDSSERRRAPGIEPAAWRRHAAPPTRSP